MGDATAVRVAIDLLRVPSRARMIRDAPLPRGWSCCPIAAETGRRRDAMPQTERSEAKKAGGRILHRGFDVTCFGSYRASRQPRCVERRAQAQYGAAGPLDAPRRRRIGRPVDFRWPRHAGLGRSGDGRAPRRL
jgi:hypothetical protein